MMKEEGEGSRGTIMNDCPHCGQFCKIPKEYWWNPKTGAFANSYCKRCKKKVKLSVEFI